MRREEVNLLQARKEIEAWKNAEILKEAQKRSKTDAEYGKYLGFLIAIRKIERDAENKYNKIRIKTL